MAPVLGVQMQKSRARKQLPLQTQQKQYELSADSLQAASSDKPTEHKQFLGIKSKN